MSQREIKKEIDSIVRDQYNYYLGTHMLPHKACHAIILRCLGAQELLKHLQAQAAKHTIPLYIQLNQSKNLHYEQTIG